MKRLRCNETWIHSKINALKKHAARAGGGWVRERRIEKPTTSVCLNFTSLMQRKHIKTNRKFTANFSLFLSGVRARALGKIFGWNYNRHSLTRTIYLSCSIHSYYLWINVRQVVWAINVHLQWNSVWIDAIAHKEFKLFRNSGWFLSIFFLFWEYEISFIFFWLFYFRFGQWWFKRNILSLINFLFYFRSENMFDIFVEKKTNSR